MSDPWLDVVRAAEHVGYADAASADPVARRRALKAFREWARRARLVPGRRGRRLLFMRADLDRAVAGRHRLVRAS
jgi:hypothetical protein